MEKKIKKRQSKHKRLLLEQLSKIPIIHVACDKVNISRSTYYRWRQEDIDFEKLADTALEEGHRIINDMAESQLISLIKDKHPTGIIFWLKHHHPAYANKLEITAGRKTDELSEDQLENLVSLLYGKNTFREGQTLLTSYVFKGLVNEKLAQLIMKIFMSQMRAEDILTRKAEADVLTEVLLKKEKSKKKYG